MNNLILTLLLILSGVLLFNQHNLKEINKHLSERLDNVNKILEVQNAVNEKQDEINEVQREINKYLYQMLTNKQRGKVL